MLYERWVDCGDQRAASVIKLTVLYSITIGMDFITVHWTGVVEHKLTSLTKSADPKLSLQSSFYSISSTLTAQM